ncbi:outer membrane beta-barrel protein [Chitinimonas sp. BJB300]|uniref:outer membrane beta-barrel protein n=1 Tax=Chitinimonas sp. BJB300 TaxID=1559339 RepID=UPI000C1095B6|nr:outer membrane beta-barrel protein [Chitinimonas sp. BJB300]PHV12278.1 hypothetical protein CSQ89_06360 [Chitinimonas sp. BJB300]TSJ88139.1 outer membrane beta-barrel protein [Chitinimonas sp. BJB300]
MKKLLPLIVVVGGFVAPAFAEDFYMGADLGRTNLKDTEDGSGFKGHATNVGVFGGYQFHPNVAVEVGYRDLGKVKDDLTEVINNVPVSVNASVKSHAVYASLLGIVPVSNETSLYGRLGAARLKVKSAATAIGLQIPDETLNKTKAMFGLGARSAVSKEFGLRVEYNQFGKIDGLKISTFFVAGDYHF